MMFLGLADDDLKRYVFLEEWKQVKTPCDIGIVFGGPFMVPYRADAAIALYQKGLIKKILVSGNRGYFCKKKEQTEAEVMATYLFSKGVPQEDIIMEKKSKSTVQNVKHSLAILKETYDIHNLKYVLITSDFHLKRCIGLMKRALQTDKNIYGMPVKDGKTDCNHWKNHSSTRKLIRREAFLLWLYHIH